MKILGIDPSVNNVGIAVYDTESKKLFTQTFHPTKGITLAKKGQEIVKQILSFAGIFQLIVAEYPTFQNSTRGHVASVKGYTIDLGFIVGYIVGCFNCESVLPTPTEWKGNLPKEAIGARFEKRFGIKSSMVSDHEFEAAMMIAWYLDFHKIV